MDLPRMPGSIRTVHEIDRHEGLAVVEIVYHTLETIDEVREHYRRVLREERWQLGEIEVDDGTWELEASKGGREVELEIGRIGTRTFIEVTVTEPLRR